MIKCKPVENLHHVFGIQPAVYFKFPHVTYMRLLILAESNGLDDRRMLQFKDEILKHNYTRYK